MICPACIRGEHARCDTTDVNNSPPGYCDCWANNHHNDLTVLQFEVAGTPQPQGSKTVTRFGGIREANKNLAPWRAEAIAAIRAEWADTPTLAAPVVVNAEFAFTRPRSHYGTGSRAMSIRLGAPVNHSQKPDLDKLLRAVGDALTQSGAIRDDSQIVRFNAGKTWTTAAPNTWVVVSLAE